MKIMKKTLLYTLCSLALTANGLTAWGQQINGDFDGEWEVCVPWDSDNNTKSQGTQPKGWCISNVSGMNGLGATSVGSSVAGLTGESGNLAVELKNTPNPFRNSEIVPAYLTLGTSWATAKASIFSVSNADGGAFGGKLFAYRPDALSFYCKRSLTGESKEKATVVAYLWRGTFTQQDVPANTSMSSIKNVTMIDRDRQVLGVDMTGCQGGATSQTDDAVCVASIIENIEGEIAEWTPMTYEFTYNSDELVPEKINVIFAADDYFGARSNITANNTLTIDDVRLVYYHSLSSCKYNGQAVTFSKNNEVVVNDVYDASKLAYEKKGVGATVEESYDETTGKLAITVKGNDYEVNKESVTTYTIQFAKPEEVKFTKDYTEELYVTIDGQTVGPQSTPVTVQTRYDGKINFLLKNFALEGMYIGNINVDGLDVEDGKFSCQDKSIEITAGDLEGVEENQWMGPTLSQMGVKANMEGRFVGDNNIKVSLSILFGGMNINVHLGYTPTIANMTVGANKYGTFYAPFAVTLPGDVKAYTCGSLNNGSTLVLTSVDGGEIPSNTAVIVESTNGTSQDFYNFEEGLKVEDGNTGLLHGVATGGKAPVGSYVLQTQEGKGQKFYLVTTDNLQVSANRCYLQLPASSDVKAISFPSDPTAIDGVKELLSGKAEIYDLEGRRLPALQKGINIVGGKKVMVK